MNRCEILFRGKRVDGKGWVYGLPTYLCDKSNNENGNIFKDCYFSNGKDGSSLFKILPDTVGQLLHIEKNGRKWFEGDVAEMEAVAHISGHPIYGDDEYLHYKYTGVVETHVRHGLCIRVHKCLDVDNDEEIIFSKNLRKTITFSRTEIIGSIHDTHLTKQS